MVSKSASGQRLRCAKLLVLFVVAACVNGVLATNTGTPSLILTHVGDQTHRRMRSTEFRTEERAFEGIAKLVNKLKPDKQKAADKLFTRLKIQETTSNLFCLKFKSWVRSVEKSYKKSPEMADVAMVITMRNQLTDQGLAKILRDAKDSYRIASRPEGTLFKSWIKDGNTADSVFRLLQLDDKADDLLANSAMNTWVSYVEKLNQNPYELLSRKVGGDETLTRMLATAKKSAPYSTRDTADSLEIAQFKAWVRDGKGADDVFTFLRLDKDGDKLFENPNFNTWASFARILDKENPQKTMLSVLKTRYSDETLVGLLDAAKQVQLRNQLWLSQGKTLDEAFSLLKLDQAGGNVFMNPELGAWVSYATKLSKVDNNLDEFAACCSGCYKYSALQGFSPATAVLKIFASSRFETSSAGVMQRTTDREGMQTVVRSS